MPNNVKPSGPPGSSTAEEATALADVLERQRNFWRRGPADRPLLRVALWKDFEPFPPLVRRDGGLVEDDTEIVPGLLDISASLDAWRPCELVEGDFVNAWGFYDICWTEAIFGCRVRRTESSVWAEPFFHRWEQVEGLSWQGSNGWLEELFEVNRMLVAKAGGVYPVSQPLMRGPLDMAAAAVPAQVLYPGFYENPRAVHRLLEVCADVFLTTAQRRLAATPPWNGGYVPCAQWGLWAPGTTARIQGDSMANLSPHMYREFFWEVDQRMASQFEWPIYHTHSACAHILPVLAEVPALKAIEVTLDPAPFGPLPLDLLPKFQLVQQTGKSLFIDGPLKRCELEILLETLSPVGLAIRAGLLDS